MATRNRNPPWSDLPQELLSAIANTLASNPINITAFRSVCKSWRSSFPRLTHPSLLSPHLPLSVTRLPFNYRGYRPVTNGRSILSVTVIYALRRPLESSNSVFSSYMPASWILFLDEYTAGKVRIHKPFLNSSYSLPITFPGTLNLFDFNVHELGRFYNLTYSEKYDQNGLADQPRFCTEDVDKVVLFPNGLAAVAIVHQGKLAMIRFDVGFNDRISKWEVIHDGKRFRFDDMIEFKGKVLGIDRRGGVYEIGCHLSKLNRVVPPIPGGGGRRKRLVEALGFLYLVVRCNVVPGKIDWKMRVETKFKVYELNEGRKKWFEISSIGDRSFFFGINFSFSASTPELGTCGKNCILFEKKSFLCYTREEDDYTAFCKSESSDLNIGVCHLRDAFLSSAIGLYPGYSDILWPPPSWLWPLDRSKRLGILETAIDEVLDKIPEKFKTKVEEQILKQILKGGGFSYGNLRQHAALYALRDALELKKDVNRFQESETKLMNEVRESIDELNQRDSKLLQARAASSGNAERLCWPDELQADHARLSRLIGMLRKHDAMVIHLEELSKELVRSWKSRLAPILIC